MQDDGRQQAAAHDPQQDAVGMQEVGVVIDGVLIRRRGGQVDLQIADQVAKHVSEKDHSGDGHHDFLTEVDS